jgi:hypothetical protein
MSNESAAQESFEVDDFSGGETDYYLMGNKQRYHKACNFLINADKKLEVRPGSQGFDLKLNHILPGSPTRVGAFLYYNTKRELLVQQAQNIYYLDKCWKPILGPEGAPANGYSNEYDSFSSQEWKGHTYFASAGGGRPGKIYRDQTGAFQVRTVGLPVPVSTPNFTKTTLLAACVALANDLRASMVAHIKDVTILHTAIDKWSLSYFEAQNFVVADGEYPGPQPKPTPAPAASDETSLYSLVLALNLAYEHHGKDPNPLFPFYHKNITINGGAEPPKGPFQLLSNNTKPADLLVAAAQLNELRQKWYWHRIGLFTHSSTNKFTSMDLYRVNTPSIQYVSYNAVPYIQPNYSEFIRYANYLKQLWNMHVSEGVFGADFNASDLYQGQIWHSQLINATQDASCPIPDALDVDAACLIIYWIWAMYGAVHFADANIPNHTKMSCNTTAGSAVISNIKDESATLSTIPVGSWVIFGGALLTDPSDVRNQYAAQVTGIPGANQATLSKPAIADNAGLSIEYSSSLYHGSYDGGNFKTVTATLVTADETPTTIPGSGLSAQNIAAVPSTLKQWSDFAGTCFQLISAHMQNAKSHHILNYPTTYLFGNGPFYKPQIATYDYAFVYKYTYTTKDGVEFESESEPVFTSVETAKQFPVGTELDTGLTGNDVTNLKKVTQGFTSTHVEQVPYPTLQNIPVLKNSLLSNYDVANITVELFRTQDGGTTYYLMDEVKNGITTYTDLYSDENGNAARGALSDQQPLYTTGGEVAHSQAPECRYFLILDNIAYYAYITDTGQVFKDQIVQSIPGAPDTGPADFSDEVGDEITGLSSCRSNVIVLCRHSLYRLTGGYNNLGQGTLSHEKISDEIGCVSSKSIVQTELGIFFAGTDGFYFTDGFQLIKVSIDRNLTYKQLVQTEAQAARITGAYDRLNRQIWWSTQSEPTGTDVDESHIFYLDYGVKPSGVFTSAANGTYWSPTALAFFEGDMIRGDRRGVLLRHNKRWKSDPKIPSSGTYEDFLAIDQWGTVHVPYLYRSCALDFGSIAVGNYVTKVKMLGKNVGNSATQFFTIADNNYNSPSKKPVAPMLYQANPRWGDATVAWGDSSFKWKYDGKLDLRRRMPRGNLRAQLKQIEARPARVGVYRYDAYPEGAFVQVSKANLTASLTTPDGYYWIQWPVDVMDMYIAFEDDGYVNEYQITKAVQEVAFIADPNSLLTEDLVDQKWVVRGYMKEASLAFLGYTLQFASFGDRGSAYTAGSGSGENG